MKTKNCRMMILILMKCNYSEQTGFGTYKHTMSYQRLHVI